LGSNFESTRFRYFFSINQKIERISDEPFCIFDGVIRDSPENPMAPCQRVLIVLGEGFEEIEAITPIDILRRAGLEVVVASAGLDVVVCGGRGVLVTADKLLAEVAHENFDLLVLPGGPGVDSLRSHSLVLDVVKRHADAGRRIAAICAAPVILADAGLLGNRKVTSFPGREAELRPQVGEYLQERVVFDGPICTSRGAGTSEEFSLALVAWLLNAEAAYKVGRSIVARTLP
jgi:protein deglycase